MCTRPHFSLCSDLLECRPRGGPEQLSRPSGLPDLPSSSVGARRTNSPSRDDIATLRAEETVAEQYRSVRSSSLRDEQGNTTVHHYPWCQWVETVPQLRAPFGERYSQLEVTLPVQPNARQKPTQAFGTTPYRRCRLNFPKRPAQAFDNPPRQAKSACVSLTRDAHMD